MSGDPTGAGSAPAPGTSAGATSTGMSDQAGTATPGQAEGAQDASAQGTSTQASSPQRTEARTTRAAGRHSARASYATSDDVAGRGAGRAEAGSTGLGGVLSLVSGLLAFLAGLAVVVRTSFYPSLPGYAYRGNTQSWGWVLLCIGVLLFAAGAIHLLGMSVGRYLAIGFAALLAIAAFLTVPYFPLWSIVLIGLSLAAIWGLARDGEDSARADGRDYDDRYGQRSMDSDTMTSQASRRM